MGSTSTTPKANLHRLSFREPTDQPDAEYPLHVNSGRVLEHFHEGNLTFRSAGLAALVSEPYVEMTRQTAADQGGGLITGDWVRLLSDHSVPWDRNGILDDGSPGIGNGVLDLIGQVAELSSLGTVKIGAVRRGHEPGQLIDDDVMLSRTDVPAQLEQERVDPAQDLRVGLAVATRLGDGNIHQGAQVGPIQHHPDLTVLIPQPYGTEISVRHLPQEGGHVPERMDSRRRVVDARRQCLVRDVGQLPEAESDVLSTGPLESGPRRSRRLVL